MKRMITLARPKAEELVTALEFLVKYLNSEMYMDRMGMLSPEVRREHKKFRTKVISCRDLLTKKLESGSE